jgi:hypothetical protein
MAGGVIAGRSGYRLSIAKGRSGSNWSPTPNSGAPNSMCLA